MVDGGNNIVEANWESVSSILQVVGAGSHRLLLPVSESLPEFGAFGPYTPLRLKTDQCAAWQQERRHS